MLEPSETIEARMRKTLTDVIGKTEKQAEKLVVKAGFSFRVVETDSNPRTITMDLSSTRVNVTLLKNRVVRAEVF